MISQLNLSHRVDVRAGGQAGIKPEKCIFIPGVASLPKALIGVSLVILPNFESHYKDPFSPPPNKKKTFELCC